MYLCCAFDRRNSREHPLAVWQSGCRICEKDRWLCCGAASGSVCASLPFSRARRSPPGSDPLIRRREPPAWTPGTHVDSCGDGVKGSDIDHCIPLARVDADPEKNRHPQTTSRACSGNMPCRIARQDPIHAPARRPDGAVFRMAAGGNGRRRERARKEKAASFLSKFTDKFALKPSDVPNRFLNRNCSTGSRR